MHYLPYLFNCQIFLCDFFFKTLTPHHDLPLWALTENNETTLNTCLKVKLHVVYKILS